MKRLIALAILLSAAVSLVGCGTGGSNGALNAVGSGTGRAVITLKWPARSTSRVIPVASNRVVVTFKRGSSVYGSPVIFDRPSSGSFVTSQTVNNLPVGSFTADALAYPDTNSGSTPQAKVLGQAFSVANGQTVTVSLTMASAISTIVVSGAGGVSTIAPSATLQVSAVAKDASNATVLVGSTITFSSNSTGVATVNSTTGLVTGVAAGTARITATDSESGVSGYVDVMVQSPAPTGIFVTDAGNGRIANFQSMTGTGWTTFGTSGSGTNQFGTPWGMARDSQGRIYIADSSSNRIVRMDTMTGSGWTTLSTDGTHSFINPRGLAIDSQDRIYVMSSGGQPKVMRVNDMTGAGWVEYGGFGTGVGQFDTPYGVAVDSTFHIYVADTSNNRIVKINDMTGAGWTTLTTCAGVSFNYPADIKVDSSGHLYIADLIRNRVCYAANISDTVGVAYGTSGNGVGNFNFPWGIALDSSGAIYVLDRNNARIVKMTDMTGAGWTTFGSSGAGTNQFSQPFGIMVN